MEAVATVPEPSGLNLSGRWWPWAALFLLVFAIIFLRAPEMVLRPALLMDDGPKVFSHFYEHRELTQIFRFKSGYMPLIGNVIGFLAVRLPTRMIPYGFVGAAVLISTCTYCCFFAGGFRRWIESDLQRALICLIFALAPLFDCLLLTMSDYSNWNLFAALLLLTALPPPKPGLWRYIHGIACNILVWSHPLAVLAAPIAVWRMVTDERSRDFYAFFLFNVLVHQVFGVAGILTMRGLWERGSGGGFGLSQITDALCWAPQIMTATAFRSAFGSPALETQQDRQFLLIAWSVIIAAATVVVAWRRPRVRRLLAYLAYIVVSLSFLCCFLRYEDVGGDPIAFIKYSPRYIYIQSLCFLLLYAVLASAAAESLRQKWRAPVRPWVTTAFLACYYCALNAQFGHYFVTNTRRASPYYDFDASNGPAVREFFDRLAEEEERRGSRTGIRLTCNKTVDWSFGVDTTQPFPPTRSRLPHRTRIITLGLLLLAVGYATHKRWIGLVLRDQKPRATGR